MLKTKNLWMIIFFLIAALLIIAALLFYPHNLLSFLGVLKTLFFPFILAVCFAFLIDKPVTFFERHLKIDNKRISRMVCTVGFIVLLLGVTALIAYPAFGSLSKSINLLIENLPGYVDQAFSAVNGFAKKLGLNIELSPSMLISDDANQTMDMAVGFYKSLSSAISTLSIGLIAAVYIVIYKDNLLRQLDRLIYALFDKKGYFLMVRVGMEANKIFSGYFAGKLLQCLLIAAVTFTALWILGIPYAMLISVIMGIANIIAMLGPVIGAVPCALLLYLESPMNALWFIVVTVAVQFIIGQILGPKLLGNSTGLPSFWVLFAVIAGAYLGGIMGMIVGIPIFAVIYIFIKEAVNLRICKKDGGIERKDKRVYNRRDKN